jgi:hypothetical protein
LFRSAVLVPLVPDQNSLGPVVDGQRLFVLPLLTVQAAQHRPVPLVALQAQFLHDGQRLLDGLARLQQSPSAHSVPYTAPATPGRAPVNADRPALVPKPKNAVRAATRPSSRARRGNTHSPPSRCRASAAATAVLGSQQLQRTSVVLVLCSFTACATASSTELIGAPLSQQPTSLLAGPRDAVLFVFAPVGPATLCVAVLGLETARAALDLGQHRIAVQADIAQRLVRHPVLHPCRNTTHGGIQCTTPSSP